MLARFAGRLLAVPIISACFLILFPTLAQAQLPSGPLLIGEVAWAGSSKSTADEWIELWNLGDEPIDLTGYRLAGASGTNSLSLDGHEIAPRSAFLIANYDAEKSAMAIDPQLVTSAVSLSNNTFKIELVDEDGVLVDTAGDGTSPPAGYSSTTKASMLRHPDGSWMTSDTSERMDDGVADVGTPGICDGCRWSEADLAAADTTSTEALPMTASSTASIIESTTSSTMDVIETTTSTEPMTEVPTTTISTTTVTTIAIPEPITLPTTEAAPTIVTTVTTRPIVYPPFRLHRVHPAPPSGSREWVELRLPSGTTLASLDGYALYDATGRIALLPPSDMTRVTILDDVIRIELTSAKLNNGGDTVELRRPDGSVVERMTYPKTASGESWGKNAEGTAWMLEGSPEETMIVEEEIVMLPPPEPVEFPVSEPDGTATESSEDVQFLSEDATNGGETPMGAATSETDPDGNVPRPTVERSLPAPKTTNVSKKNVIYEIAHDMLTKIEPNVRVAITGTVATKPGILNKNHYVLLSPDGHGLYVRGSSKQPTPPMGSVVRVTGTLTLNDDGLSLGVGSKDRWEGVSTPVADPAPRVVDFLAPSLEDGWSLVEAEGVIREVKSTRALLDLGDALVSITIKAASGYRAARLKEGDAVRVRGLADLRGEEPAIVVRAAQDVEIRAHATLAPAADPPKGLPLWMPFGAAGITVAASEGFKRLSKLRERRRVQGLIEKARTADGV